MEKWLIDLCKEKITEIRTPSSVAIVSATSELTSEENEKMGFYRACIKELRDENSEAFIPSHHPVYATLPDDEKSKWDYIAVVTKSVLQPLREAAQSVSP